MQNVIESVQFSSMTQSINNPFAKANPHKEISYMNNTQEVTHINDYTNKDIRHINNTQEVTHKEVTHKGIIRMNNIKGIIRMKDYTQERIERQAKQHYPKASLRAKVYNLDINIYEQSLLLLIIDLNYDMKPLTIHVKELAKKAKMCERQALYSLASLAQKEYISREKVKGKHAPVIIKINANKIITSLTNCKS